MWVEAGRGVVPMTSQNLNGILSSVLEIRFLKVGRGGTLIQTRLGLLPTQPATRTA